MKPFITITCPDCGGLLDIDVSREKIVGHKRRLDAEREAGKSGTEIFEDAVHRVEDRKKDAEAAFEDALRSESEVEKRLDALFEEVKEKVKEEKKRPIKKDPRDLFWD